MKKLKYAILAMVILLGAASCSSGNKGNNASSTPIDSTNASGAAPAVYGADDPANPDSARNQGSFEEGNRVNTTSSEDTMKGRY